MLQGREEGPGIGRRMREPGTTVVDEYVQITDVDGLLPDPRDLLATTDWSSLEHACGSAEGTPAVLAGLLADDAMPRFRSRAPRRPVPGFPLRQPRSLDRRAAPSGASSRTRGTDGSGWKGTWTMKVTKLVSTCDIKECPTIYATDRGTLLVQGGTPTDHGLRIPAHEALVEIPVELIRKAVRDNLI